MAVAVLIKVGRRQRLGVHILTVNGIIVVCVGTFLAELGKELACGGCPRVVAAWALVVLAVFCHYRAIVMIVVRLEAAMVCTSRISEEKHSCRLVVLLLRA